MLELYQKGKLAVEDNYYELESKILRGLADQSGIVAFRGEKS